MADFHYAVRAECYVGPDTIFKLPLIMHEIADRVLLIVDPSLVNQSIVKKIQAILDNLSPPHFSQDSCRNKFLNIWFYRLMRLSQ